MRNNLLILLALVAPLTGCIVHSRGQPRERVIVRERSCPRGTHAERNGCVQNGQRRGHDDDDHHGDHGDHDDHHGDHHKGHGRGHDKD